MIHIYIKLMSESETRLFNRLVDTGAAITRALVFMFMYPRSPEIKYRRKQLYKMLNVIERPQRRFFKPKNPSVRFIQKALSAENDTIEGIIAQTRLDHPHECFMPIDVKNMTTAVEMYQEWIAFKLSTKGVVTLDEVYRELDAISDKSFK